MSKFRNGCIALVGAMSASSAFAEGDGLASAAGKALDAAQSDVGATGPKVLMVVAAVVSVGILISLVRKA
ncbi:Flexible pilin [Aeromonas salmonicida]|uniref:Flexible pilin n=1 Tax=Aeromonas salmonicida TaxID=645 RepID=UPI00259DAF3F|nr:Flexible pilin [Aeromonas salmonicida]MDM5069863.1 Flexible pilin [Aeromonas salmonicida]MDM5069873.1 Flexible pilin [Aeromonas salmonicida]